jgi:hypothetical protein
MWLAAWLRTLGFNLLFIGGLCLMIAFAIDLLAFPVVLPGAVLTVFGARGLRRMALT